MNKRQFRLIMMIAMVVVDAGCAARHNSSDRVGTGYLSRAEPGYNPLLIASTGTQTSISPNSPTDMVNFFTNYMNSDGSLFQLPCQPIQINLSANVNASPLAGSVSIPSSGAQMHLDFIP